MRFSHLFSAVLLTALSTVGTLGLGGCAAKTEAEPEVPCGTYATVRLCLGNTLMCPTEHTTLELADGTRLNPTGPLWQAYQPSQANGVTLHIGYKLTGAPVPPGSPASISAQLTCLEQELPRCPPMASDGD